MVSDEVKGKVWIMCYLVSDKKYHPDTNIILNQATRDKL